MARILPGETDIYALTDSRLSLGRPLEHVCRQLLEAGVKILQYREKHASMRQKYEDCLIARQLCNEYGACFIVNDHLDLALMTHADGLHIGQDDLPVAEIRKLAPDLIIGLSTHSPAQASAALAAGVDYIGVGPIYPTNTKEDVVPPVGLEYLDYVVSNVPLPFVAIGGIKAHNVDVIARHGARCCALVSELVGAKDIQAKVVEVRRIMRENMKDSESSL